MEGVCIEFEKARLDHSLTRAPLTTARKVDYLTVKALESFVPADANRLPFVKREGYSDEREWRVVATTEDTAQLTLDVPVELASISRLILNPWLPPSLADNLRIIIRQIDGCASLKIEASALTNSIRWKAAGRNLVA